MYSQATASLTIEADHQADFTDLPFPDNTFALVVFDPPHFERNGATGWVGLKYGTLKGDWREELRRGFAECFRVLRPEGVLIFKWCEDEIPVSQILALTPERPLFAHRSGKQQKTHWVTFMKPNAPLMCAACGVIIQRFVSSLCVQTLNQPDFNNRLPRNTNTSRFTIQRLDYPSRKVDIYALLLLVSAARGGQIKIINDVFFTFVKFLVKIFSFHTAQPLVCENVSQK